MMDYCGGMESLKKELALAGVPEEFINLDDYNGLTYPELQGIVDGTIACWEHQKDTYVAPKFIGKIDADENSTLRFEEKCGCRYEYRPFHWHAVELLTGGVIRVKWSSPDYCWRTYKIKHGTVSVNGEVVA